MAYSGTRSEAREKDEHLYFTGAPCKRGHIAPRFTRTAICTECNREQSRAWSSANPDKKRGMDAAYIANNREQKKARDRAYRAENRDVILARKREYFARTVEDRHAAAKLWREANPEKSKAAQHRFRAANPHKINAWAAMRRARKQQARYMLSSEQLTQIQDFYAEARALTEKTGIRHEVDHIHPLAGSNFSGLHVPWNLQILPSHENKRKGNRLVETA